MNRREIQDFIIARAKQDLNFKQALIDSPKKTVEQTGIPLPDTLTIRVLVETETTLYLVVPPASNTF